MNFNRIIKILLLIALLFPLQQGLASKSGLGDLLDSASEPIHGQQVDAIIPRPEDTVRAREKHPGGTFWVKSRKDQIERFRCSRCHTNKPGKPQVNDGLRLAHGDISLSHGQEQLACLTCHNDQERDFLALKGGDKIDFDHAYQLCGQCHFRQKKDWIGGAHGKRDSYWDGERVIWSCTECHNPHSPRFEKRWPETYSKPLGG